MNDREGAMLALVEIFSVSPGPMGTRHARSELSRHGYDLSESSISRLLREMDRRGWTQPVSAKGRVLAAEGRRRAADAVLAKRGSESVTRAVAVRDVKDLLDLLRARQAVESAIAGDAARSTNTDDLHALRQIHDTHRSAVGSEAMIAQPGLMFHRKIAAMATNRMLKLAADMMLAPHLDRVESVLDLAVRSEQDGVVDEHAHVLDRIAHGDPAGAEQAMNEHFASMIAAAEASIVGQDDQLVQRLLDWIEAGGHEAHPTSG